MRPVHLQRMTDEERKAFYREKVRKYHAHTPRAKRSIERIPPGDEHMFTDRQLRRGKVRMSSGWTRVMREIEESGKTMQEFVAGMSVEELVRGRLRGSNGKFNGRPPKWVPREFQQACLQELMTRGQELWLGNYIEAIQAMVQIAKGQGVGAQATPGERLKAAQFVIERLEGKVPERLVVSQEQRWQTVLEGIVAEVSDEQVIAGRRALEGGNGTIIEGEVADEDPPAPARSRRRRRQ